MVTVSTVLECNSHHATLVVSHSWKSYCLVFKDVTLISSIWQYMSTKKQSLKKKMTQYLCQAGLCIYFEKQIVYMVGILNFNF